MKKIFVLLNLTVAVLFLAGCGASPEQQLEQAQTAETPQLKIALLRSAYAQFQTLENSEPATRIPQQVYGLAMQTGDLGAFQWALENGAQWDLHYLEISKFWKLGPAWQDWVMASHPDEALPVFMDEALKKYSRRFIFKYLEPFKASGFKPHRLMVEAEFNARFCRFLAGQMERAMEKGDVERLEFLTDNTPHRTSESLIYAETADVFRQVGTYFFQTLESEPLTLKMVELGYDQNPLDLSSPVFGDSLATLLRARPGQAIRSLGLDEWKGALTPAEVDFLGTLPEEALGALSLQYIDEASALCMTAGDDEGVLRYIRLHAQKEPFDQATYVQLMNRSARHSSIVGFDYVLEHCDDIDIFSLDLAALAETQVLFVKYAPQMMKKIYPTMRTLSKDDGVTLGKVLEVFAAENEAAGLFIVRKYNLSKVWAKTTNGRTMLMDVCGAGNLSAARYLIETRGENIRATTGYRQLEVTLFGRIRPMEGKLDPLFFAAQSGNSELIRYIVTTKRVNPNSRSNFGATPLMYAVSADQLDAVKTLIELRADVNLSMDDNLNNGIDMIDLGDYDNLSNAYRRAKSRELTDVLEVLEAAGAHP